MEPIITNNQQANKFLKRGVIILIVLLPLVIALSMVFYRGFILKPGGTPEEADGFGKVPPIADEPEKLKILFELGEGDTGLSAADKRNALYKLKSESDPKQTVENKINILQLLK